MLNKISCNTPIYNTYGRVYKIMFSSVIVFIAVITPFTNFILLPLAYKLKNKELMRIDIHDK